MYIVRGTQNTVVVSFQEKATTANPEFIIKFTSDVTGESKVIAVTDTSDYTERYNLFRITETSDEDFYNSKLELTPSGQWTYTAYEMAESSPRNLNTDDALSTVESGVCIVYDGAEGSVNNFTEEESKDNPVFDDED